MTDAGGTMRSIRLQRVLLAIAAAALLVPSSAQAFSFGTFAPGERILSVQISGSPTVSFDSANNKLAINGSISTITTNQNVFGIPLGDVTFSSEVTIVPGTETVSVPLDPIPSVFAGLGGQLGAQFTNGVAADLSILDAGPGGAGILLDGEYVGTLAFQAGQPAGFGTPVTGSLDSDFVVSGGDASFTAAFGPGGTFFGNLAALFVNNNPVSGNFCLLVEGGCPSGTTIASFTASPTITITPIPEPGIAVLLALGLAALTLRRPAA